MIMVSGDDNNRVCCLKCETEFACPMNFVKVNTGIHLAIPNSHNSFFIDQHQRGLGEFIVQSVESKLEPLNSLSKYLKLLICNLYIKKITILQDPHYKIAAG